MRRPYTFRSLLFVFLLVLGCSGSADDAKPSSKNAIESQTTAVNEYPILPIIAEHIGFDVQQHSQEEVDADIDVRITSDLEDDDIILYLINSQRRNIDTWFYVLTGLFALGTLVIAGFAVVLPLMSFGQQERFKEESSRMLDEIRVHERTAKQKADSMPSAEDAEKDAEETQTRVKEIQNDPEATVFEKAVAEALSLQAEERHKEAKEKWLSIANLAEASNPNIAAQAWFSVGYLLQIFFDEEANVLEIIAAYDNSIRLMNNNPNAYNNRGHAKLKLGNFEEAIVDFDEAVRLAPSDPAMYSGRGHARMLNKDFSGAFDDSSEAVRIDTRNIHYVANLANDKKEIGDLDGAIADYDAIIRVEPNEAAHYSNRGTAKAHKEDFDGAETDFRKAISLEPDNIYFADNLDILIKQREASAETDSDAED